MIRLLLLVIAGIMASADLSAQSGNLGGKIVNQADRESIPFGTIRIFKDVKLMRTTTSDIDGTYKVENISCGTYTLKVNCVGYDSLIIADVPIHASSKLTMNLEVKRREVPMEIIPIPNFIPKKKVPEFSPNISPDLKFIPRKGFSVIELRQKN